MENDDGCQQEEEELNDPTRMARQKPEDASDRRPGITGLAQVDNGYDEDLESVERKVEMDLRYMDRFSLRRDLAILGRTVVVVLTGRGAC